MGNKVVGENGTLQAMNGKQSFAHEELQ